MVESNGNCLPEIIEMIKEDRKYFAKIQSYKAGKCERCYVKMTVITTSLRGKRQKIGSFCPVCHDINNWVK